MKVGWEFKRLDEVCVIRPPKSEVRKKLEAQDEVSFVPMEDLGIGQKYLQPKHTRFLKDVAGSYTYFADNDVLLAKITPCFENGKIGIARGLRNGVGFGSSEYIVLRPDEKNSPEFIYYYLTRSAFFEEGAQKMTGAVGHKRVSKEFIESYPTPIPPLSEQKRIVAILDQAFAAIATAKAHAEQNLHNARALFESHLQAVFSQRGEGWVQKPLGEIGKVSMCKRIFKEETKSTGEIPFFKIGTFGKKPDAFIPKATFLDYKSKYPFPKKGDVLLSAAGTIGRRVIYDGEDAYFQDSNIVWINNNEKELKNNYLFHFYGVCEWGATTGATIKRLYNDNLREIVVSFPVSLQRQEAIASSIDHLLEQTQALESLYQRKIAALDELKQSLLHQAFNGEL